MPKFYCRIHGEYTLYGDDRSGCPDCLQAQYDQESNSEALAEKLEQLSTQTAAAAIIAAHKTNNPGDYKCPACMMISLKDGAMRCPVCRADVPSGYWDGIRDQERLLERQKQQAKIDRQKWLESPEYAEEVRRDEERRKLDLENQRQIDLEKEWKEKERLADGKMGAITIGMAVLGAILVASFGSEKYKGLWVLLGLAIGGAVGRGVAIYDKKQQPKSKQEWLESPEYAEEVRRKKELAQKESEIKETKQSKTEEPTNKLASLGLLLVIAMGIFATVRSCIK